MYQDYLADDPTFGLTYFRRRYRMNRELFVRIMNAVEEYDGYFERRISASGEFGLSCFQKLTAMFRMLTYGLSADATDEYCCIGESTTQESMRRFVRAVIVLFGEEYLRSPNENDTARLLALADDRGFSGMLESIDCMYWRWEKCYECHCNFEEHMNWQ